MHQATGRTPFLPFIDTLSFRRRESMGIIFVKWSWHHLHLWFSPLLGAWEGRVSLSIVGWPSYYPDVIQWLTAALLHGYAAHFHSPCCGQRQCASGKAAPSLLDILTLPQSWALWVALGTTSLVPSSLFSVESSTLPPCAGGGRQGHYI